MTRKKLFEDIKQNPPRIYRSPADILRDRRLNDMERLEILRAWRDLHAGPEEIDALIVALEARFYSASDHAAE